jgi:3-oxoacyl-[acyl-carrier-protein] synthase-1
MVDGRGNPIPAALDPRLDPKLPIVARLTVLATSVLEEALSSLPPALWQPSTIEVLLALPEGRPGFSNENVATIVENLRRWPATGEGRGLPVEVVGRGHAGALEALRVAYDRLTAGRVKLCAIVATDSYFDADTIDWLDRNRQIATEGIRDGFPLGEAAGCLVLMASETAERLRLASLATLRGVASAREHNIIKGPNEGLGRGLTEAISAATAMLQLPDEGIDTVFCDINGERYRSQEWAFSVLRLGAALRTSDYTTLVSCCGDVGAASGVLLCVLAARSWALTYGKGPRALIWCSSEGGQRSAAVLERPSDGS